MRINRAKGVAALGLPGFVPTPPRTSGRGSSGFKGIPRQPLRHHQRPSTAPPFAALGTVPAVKPTLEAPAQPAAIRHGRMPEWLADYQRHVVALDSAVVVACVLIGQLSRFDPEYALSLGPVDLAHEWLISAAVISSWLLLLAMNRAWDSASLGVGRTEYRGVVAASLLLLAVVGMVASVSGADLFRGYLIVGVPLGAAGLLAGHRWWRRGLSRHRRSGTHLRSLLVVGDPLATARLRAVVRNRPEAGYRLVGESPLDASLSDTQSMEGFDGVTGTVRWSTIPASAVEHGAEMVAVTATGLTADCLPELSWRLRHAGVRLTVDRSLLGNIGADARDLVPGLPLVAVSGVELRPGGRFVKAVMDVAISAVAVLVLSPFLLVATLLVVLADGGPALTPREWRGTGGRDVRVWSFRCTPRRPKARLTTDSPAAGDDGPADRPAPQYHIDITRVGAVLRRTGLENAPQLFAVLTGQASLVGPRPRAASEPATLPVTVKPGLTGPWRLAATEQAKSGSEQNISATMADHGAPVDQGRLGDARESFAYIGSWSAVGDLTMMAKTVATVLAGRDRH
jgi:lipopolysaccharide/colanic/teichoic acid biosynthesis glycosyltransferase